MALKNTYQSSDQLSGGSLSGSYSREMAFRNNNNLSDQLSDSSTSDDNHDTDQTVTLAIARPQFINLDENTVTVDLDNIAEEDVEEDDEEDVEEDVEEIDYSENRMNDENIRGQIREAQHYMRIAHNDARNIPNGKEKKHILAIVNNHVKKNENIITQMNSVLNKLISMYAELDKLTKTKDTTFFRRQKLTVTNQIEDVRRKINIESAKMRNLYIYIPSVVNRNDHYLVETRRSNPSPEWIPSVIKPRGKKSNKKKEMVVSGEYDTATAMKTDIEEPTNYFQHLNEQFLLHKTRRGRCALDKDYVFHALSSSLENDAIISATHHQLVKEKPNPQVLRHGTRKPVRINFQEGQLVQCFEVGTNKQVMNKNECVLVRCPCYPNPKTADLIENISECKAVIDIMSNNRCNKYIMANDPKLTNTFTPEQLVQWDASVENVRINLLRQKYGREYVNFCPNKDCKHCTEPFMDKTVMDALMGKLTSGVHINKRSCPECTTTWCLECGQQPYHERQICQGPVEKLNELFKDLEGIERTKAMAEVRICPNRDCQVIVYRDGGCDHLHCKQCSTHFCYRCRGTLDSDINRTYKHTCPADVEYDSRIHETYSGGSDGYDVKASLTQLKSKHNPRK
jgi:hypothetical protein